MKKKILLPILLLLITSCATQRNVVSEQMLPDGVTWLVQVNYANRCSQQIGGDITDIFSSNSGKQQQERINKCVEELKPALMEQGKELCGQPPHRVFGCSVGDSAVDGNNVMRCYVECTDKYKK